MTAIAQRKAPNKTRPASEAEVVYDLLVFANQYGLEVEFHEYSFGRTATFSKVSVSQYKEDRILHGVYGSARTWFNALYQYACQIENQWIHFLKQSEHEWFLVAKAPKLTTRRRNIHA